MARVLAERIDVDCRLLLESGSLSLDALKVDVGNLSLITIEDLGELLEGRALGLNVEEVHEEEFNPDPDLLIESAMRVK